MAYVTPNFTEYGIGLTRAPEELTAALQREIRQAILEGNTRKEEDLVLIGGPHGPQFIDRPDLLRRVSF
jgi:hypothetical protein